MRNLYIGLMSGTSLDGVDCVIYDFENSKLIASSFTNYDKKLKQEIKNLFGKTTLESIAKMDIKLATIYADCVNNLLDKENINPKQIIAIGNHGQTIYHAPKKYSWQLGNNALLSQKTNITVIGDFRTKDILAGGQGAPLTPKYHQYLLGSDGSDGNNDGTIVNLGGIANITQIQNDNILGFDTGPANTLIDNYMFKIKGISFDRDGLFARSGLIIDNLLKKMLADDYFQKPPPKSTGVEYFNLDWLGNFLKDDENLQDKSPQDIIRTLTEFTALTISQHLTTGKVYFCGGGVFNTFLMERLQYLNPHCEILTTNDLENKAIHPNFVEAVAFAYFAKLHIENKTGNLPSVSGAKKEVILGTKYQ
jgi:anhydro-N-acetylmuramic acid kinase